MFVAFTFHALDRFDIGVYVASDGCDEEPRAQFQLPKPPPPGSSHFTSPLRYLNGLPYWFTIYVCRGRCGIVYFRFRSTFPFPFSVVKTQGKVSRPYCARLVRLVGGHQEADTRPNGVLPQEPLGSDGVGKASPRSRTTVRNALTFHKDRLPASPPGVRRRGLPTTCRSAIADGANGHGFPRLRHSCTLWG